jgi:hypothetical protein
VSALGIGQPASPVAGSGRWMSSPIVSENGRSAARGTREEEPARPPRTDLVVDDQLRRYFLGLVGFAFVVTWATLGAVIAVLAVVACAALVAGPKQLGRRRRPARPRPIRSRPLLDEGESLPLVPDEPSLILEFG